MWRNDIKCKYMFMFSLKNLACKGLKLTIAIPISCPHKQVMEYLLWIFRRQLSYIMMRFKILSPLLCELNTVLLYYQPTITWIVSMQHGGWDVQTMYPNTLGLVKWIDVSLQNVVKSWSCEIVVKHLYITLKFDKHLSSTAAEMLVEFHRYLKILN